MTRCSDEQIAENKRATERARAVLRPGDRLLVKCCGGSKSTVTMLGWQEPPLEDWIYSKCSDEIHAMHIVKVNGVRMTFGDPSDNDA